MFFISFKNHYFTKNLDCFSHIVTLFTIPFNHFDKSLVFIFAAMIWQLCSYHKSNANFIDILIIPDIFTYSLYG
nr:hypothetical protein [Escherichia coli]